uniref:Exportin-T n=1 Tax=Scophthalmus maximus TaxID=52904 RepID=A0A8D3D821_SCOMX
MDEQALMGLNPNADARYRQRAMAYFEQLKESHDAWEICAESLAKGIYNDDHVKFFCFQVLEHQIKFRHGGLSAAQQQLIRETLMKWLQCQLMSAQPEKPFIRNKAAQVFALTFIMEYLTLWPKFFFDVLTLVGLNPHGVDIYLRTLMAIDGEVVDRDILHSPEVPVFPLQETRRNTLIKDAMREQCIPSLVESWFQILQTYQRSHPELTCQCLEVVGAFVSWIDLNLIANDRFVNVLLSQMSVDELREEACDCLFEIINKGMDPVDKTKLVESLCRVLQSAGFFNVEQEDDVDFLAKFSRLVNGMGQSLVLSWTKLIKSGNVKEAAETLQAVEAKVPLMLQLLVHEDDDISANIVGFCYEYLHVLKQSRRPGSVSVFALRTLTHSCWCLFCQGEDEAMFVEYRKQLKMLLDRLAQVSPELLLEAVRRVFTNTMQTWQTSVFMEVEVAIRLLYMLGEALPASHGAHFSGDMAKTNALQDMMRTLVSCGVSGFQHSSVSLEFFETVVRYDKFFLVEPQHIPNVLMAFLDQRGLRHNSPKVRSRVAYLFSRFIKTLHKHMNAFIEDILTRIQDLLELAPPDNGFLAMLTSDDQLFMFETAGVLIVNAECPAERKQALMRSLLAPLMDAFRLLLAKLPRESEEERQAALGDCLSHAIGAWSSPSSREPWTSPTPSPRRPASSSCPSWWSCGVRNICNINKLLLISIIHVKDRSPDHVVLILCRR